MFIFFRGKEYSPLWFVFNGLSKRGWNIPDIKVGICLRCISGCTGVGFGLNNNFAHTLVILSLSKDANTLVFNSQLNNAAKANYTINFFSVH